MFGWLEDLINGITGAISDAFAGIGQTISNTIWSTMMKWMYETVFDAIADFFTMMGSMGAEIFDLSWVQATVELFTLFGWALFAAGVVVAVFDLAIEYQNGRANIKTTALNILKGFFACSLIGVVPISLYKFCISLQHEFAGNLASLFAGGKATSIAQQSLYILQHNFAQEMVTGSLFNLLALIAFAYCVIKVFFQNIKRGGILLVQMSVGSLYMFSVPRGYSDGFTQWMKHGHVQPCTFLRIDIQMKLSIDVEPCFHVRDDNLLPLVIHLQIVNAQILCFQFVVAFHSFLLICLPSRPFSKD